VEVVGVLSDVYDDGLFGLLCVGGGWEEGAQRDGEREDCEKGTDGLGNVREYSHCGVQCNRSGMSEEYVENNERLPDAPERPR
jgi:hypothetical protein